MLTISSVLGVDLPFALAQVRTLDAVVRHGSFSRAAAELKLTQPAVSMQVRQLETALGLPLVERMGKRAFATRAGELLLEHSARAVRELETAVQMLQRLRGRVAGRIRIGTSASLSIYVLPPVFRSFRARHPDSSSSSSPATRRRSRTRSSPTSSTSGSPACPCASGS